MKIPTVEPLIVGAVVCVIAALALVSCHTVGRWMAPIQPEELPAAAQELLKAKDKEKADAVNPLTEQIEKLKAAKARTGELVFLGAIALGILTGGASLFWMIWGDKKSGAAGAVASAGVVVACGTWLRYGHVFALICAVALAALVLMGVVYAGALLRRRFVGVIASVEEGKGVPVGAVDRMAAKQDDLGIRDAVRKVRQDKGWRKLD